MIRPVALLLASILLGAADMPVPPIPPVARPLDEAAPIPDAGARPPRDVEARGTRVTVEDFRATPLNVSHGFAPGSRYQSGEDRKMVQTPGLIIRMPLQ